MQTSPCQDLQMSAEQEDKINLIPKESLTLKNIICLKRNGKGLEGKGEEGSTLLVLSVSQK